MGVISSSLEALKYRLFLISVTAGETVTATTIIANIGKIASEMFDVAQHRTKMAEEIAKTGNFKTSKFAKYAGYLKVLKGAEFIQVFINFAAGGSIEAVRHREIMEQFSKIHNRFDELDRKLDGIEARLRLDIWKAASIAFESKLKAAKNEYKAYMKVEKELAGRGETCQTTEDKDYKKVCNEHKESLITFYQTGQEALIAIESIVKEYAPAIADGTENCHALLVYKIEITEILTYAHLAFDLGCSLDPG